MRRSPGESMPARRARVPPTAGPVRRCLQRHRLRAQPWRATSRSEARQYHARQVRRDAGRGLGLAKVVSQRQPPSSSHESPLQPSSASGSAPTQMGMPLGTPGYMSPEQAAGRVDGAGPASDVYGLGATLYALLTGRPPLTGDDVGAILRRVERGDFPRPRQVKPGTPRALEAVCLKAMATDPNNGNLTPPALADDVERWLADEAVQAHQEPFLDTARRWARCHRLAVAVAAVLLVGTSIALAIGNLLVRHERDIARLERDRASGTRRGRDRQSTAPTRTLPPPARSWSSS